MASIYKAEHIYINIAYDYSQSIGSVPNQNAKLSTKTSTMFKQLVLILIAIIYLSLIAQQSIVQAEESSDGLLSGVPIVGDIAGSLPLVGR